MFIIICCVNYFVILFCFNDIVYIIKYVVERVFDWNVRFVSVYNSESVLFISRYDFFIGV